MMHIKYRLGPSTLHGIGVFADEGIQAGAVVYTANPLLDLNITPKQFKTLSKNEQQEVRWWGFLDQITGKWHVDFDVSKFMNHSDVATTTQDSSRAEAYLIATRDIKVGEELTQNYREFESEDDLRARGIRI